MIKLEKITKKFNNNVLAVDNLSLYINKGEIYTLLGANGAGKSTTINLIFNFISPTSGTILVNDIDVDKNPLEAKKHLAYVSENVTLYENFSAVQNLSYFSKFGGKSHYQTSDYIKILKQVGLNDDAHHRKLKHFSKGMRQKCGIAIAIAKDADYIILDEPTTGLDPQSIREFIRTLTIMKEMGKSILMTTHDIFRAKEVSDRIGIMTNGLLVKELKAEDIKNEDIEKIYLQYINTEQKC